jgi:hypothetical protein
MSTTDLCSRRAPIRLLFSGIQLTTHFARPAASARPGSCKPELDLHAVAAAHHTNDALSECALAVGGVELCKVGQADAAVGADEARRR